MPTNLTIPEIKGNFYGGYPYSVDLQIGTFDSPSTLSISTINDTGIYSTPNLSWKDIITIQMGSLTFKGYLVKYQKNKSVGQKTLELYYHDCSNILDKIYVGLHKRHGINPNLNGLYDYSPTMNFKGIKSNLKVNKNPYLIIVGRELHPCDKNKNGIIDQEDIDSSIDWCDPCAHCPPDKYKYSCTSLNDLKIFDVAYSFDELCLNLGIIPPEIPSIKTILRTYTGTLRSVLQAWCNEFSLSFFWDFGATNVSSGLVLFDRSVPITVNTNIDECKTTEIFEGESIENNFASSVISYYQREGNNKNYQCTNSAFYNLNTLKIRDLLNPNNYLYLDADVKWKELAVCLSYYSTSLRDCMWWFNYYGITTAENAKKWIVDPIQSKLIGHIDKTLKPFGNMQILKVIDVNDPNFKECQRQLGDAVKIFDKRSKDLKRDASNPSYYFFIAKYDKELLVSQANYDATLASEFIGNHWIKLTDGPGCQGANTNVRYGGVSIDDPEGGANWISATADCIFGDFVKFGHEQGSKIDAFLKTNNISLEKAPRGSIQVDVGGGNFITLETIKSLIYKKRTPSWYPHNSEMSNYQPLMDYYKTLVWKLVNTSVEGNDSQFLSTIDASFAGKSDIALFVVQETANGQPLPITLSEVKNFLEPGTPKILRGSPQENETCISYSEANRNSKFDNGPILGSYGLMDNKSAWVTFDGFSFMAPVQSTELTSAGAHDSVLDQNNDLTNRAGYRVRATSSFNIPVCIPKIQQSVVQISDQVDAAPKQELSFLDISDDDLLIFGSNSCVPDANAIMKIHEAKSASISKSKISPERNSEYKMVGVAPDGVPLIKDGLDSLKISVSDNGVFTTFSLSDKIAKPLSENTILNQVLMGKFFMKGNYQSSSNLPIKNAGNSQIPTIA